MTQRRRAVCACADCRAANAARSRAYDARSRAYDARRRAEARRAS